MTNQPIAVLLDERITLERRQRVSAALTSWADQRQQVRRNAERQQLISNARISNWMASFDAIRQHN